MIGLVIVTHGRLAEEFVFAMEHVVGPTTAAPWGQVQPAANCAKAGEGPTDTAKIAIVSARSAP